LRNHLFGERKEESRRRLLLSRKPFQLRPLSQSGRTLEEFNEFTRMVNMPTDNYHSVNFSQTNGDKLTSLHFSNELLLLQLLLRLPEMLLGEKEEVVVQGDHYHSGFVGIADLGVLRDLRCAEADNRDFPRIKAGSSRFIGCGRCCRGCNRFGEEIDKFGLGHDQEPQTMGRSNLKIPSISCHLTSYADHQRRRGLRGVRRTESGSFLAQLVVPIFGNNSQCALVLGGTDDDDFDNSADNQSGRSEELGKIFEIIRSVPSDVKWIRFQSQLKRIDGSKSPFEAFGISQSEFFLSGNEILHFQGGERRFEEEVNALVRCKRLWRSSGEEHINRLILKSF
jgi:hypothetical protein